MDPSPGLTGDAAGQDAARDLESGEAAGRSLRERPETIRTEPPVSLIQERAAARARAVRRTLAGVAAAAMLIVGGLVAWNMLGDDGTGTVVVSPDDPDAPDADATAADGDGAPAVATQPDDEAGEPGTGQEPDAAPAATDPPRVEDEQGRDSEAPTPEELSTGPVLQWTEIDAGLDLYGIESVGDGRIIARAWPDSGAAEGPVTGRIVVTANGIDWTDVPMPADIVPDQIDISGSRWVVAGPEAGADPFDSMPSRAFFSDDEGASWTEVGLVLPSDPTPVSPYVIETSWVTSALESGESIVLVVAGSRRLDLAALMRGRNLVPEGRLLVGWESSLEGSVDLDLVERPGSGATPDAADSFQHGYAYSPVETISLTYDELGFTSEERSVFEDPGFGRVLVYASDGSAAGLVAEHEGWSGSGVGTGEGFVIMVNGPRATVFASHDGRTWTEQPVPDSGSGTVGPDGRIWHKGFDAAGDLSIRRAGFGEPPATVATFEGLRTAGSLAVGPGGLLMTAVHEAGAAFDTTARVPTGRVSKDGYELRYNEPEGGITLWDLDAGTAVYVFESEQLLSEEPPEGVRETYDEDGIAVAFEDPEAGADLVTFSYEDLAPIFDPGGDGTAAPLALEEYEPPELWVGWSADGTAWGWQLMADAFEIADGEAWAEFAVGGDFVLARVETIELPEIPVDAGGQAESGTDGETGGPGSGSVGISVGWGPSSGGVGVGYARQLPRWFIGRAS